VHVQSVSELLGKVNYVATRLCYLETIRWHVEWKLPSNELSPEIVLIYALLLLKCRESNLRAFLIPNLDFARLFARQSPVFLLKKRPSFARLFKKMSSSDEFVTLKVRCWLSWKEWYIIPFPKRCMPSPLLSIWLTLLYPFFTASLPLFFHEWENETFCVKCGLNASLRTKSAIANFYRSSVCIGHFPTDLSIFCGILSQHTFTHFCTGHFPTDLRIILSHFVAKDVYALLLNPCRKSFFLAGSLFSFPCLSQNLSSTPVQILPCTDHSFICRGFLSNVCFICRGNFEAVDLNHRQPDNYILWNSRFNYFLWIPK